jgi:hypothetical protein
LAAANLTVFSDPEPLGSILHDLIDTRSNIADRGGVLVRCRWNDHVVIQMCGTSTTRR